MTHRAFTVYKPDGVTITLPTEGSLESWQDRGLIDDSDLVVDLHGRWVRGGDVPPRPTPGAPTLQAQQTQTNLTLPVQRARPIPVWLAAVATLIVAFAAAAAIAQLRSAPDASLHAARGAAADRSIADTDTPTGVVTLAMVDGKQAIKRTAPAPASQRPVRDTRSIAAAATTAPRPGAGGRPAGEAFVGPPAQPGTKAADTGMTRAERRAAKRAARRAARAEKRAMAKAEYAARAERRKAAAAERAAKRKARRAERREAARLASKQKKSTRRSDERAPRSVSGTTVEDLDSFSGLLKEARRARHRSPEKAVELYTRALARKPGHASAMAGLAMSLQRSGQAYEALETFRACTNQLPRYGPCLAGLGKLLERFGDHAGARTAYQTYLDATPNGTQSKAIRQRLEGLRR